MDSENRLTIRTMHTIQEHDRALTRTMITHLREEQSMVNSPENYQRKIEALYANEAAANFKREFYPADPFENGVLVDAADLDVDDLVAIFRATKNLEAAGHQPFVNTLILSRRNLNLPPMVRVNPLWVNRHQQQKIEVCELLHELFFGSYHTFGKKRQEIIDTGDTQLLEFVRQVEETLHLRGSEQKKEVIVDEN